MKLGKKLLVCLLCIGVICCVAACGRNKTNDNNHNNTDKGNVVDDIGNAVQDGVQDVEDGINDMTESNRNNNNMNGATDGTEKRMNP